MTPADFLAVRQALGLSQARLAHIMGVGEHCVGSWEVGRMQGMGQSVRLSRPHPHVGAPTISGQEGSNKVSEDFDRGYAVGLATRESVFQLRETRDRLLAENADLLAALKDITHAYQDLFDIMPVAWQTYDNIAQAAIARATGGRP